MSTSIAVAFSFAPCTYYVIIAVRWVEGGSEGIVGNTGS